MQRGEEEISEEEDEKRSRARRRRTLSEKAIMAESKALVRCSLMHWLWGRLHTGRTGYNGLDNILPAGIAVAENYRRIVFFIYMPYLPSFHCMIMDLM